MKALTIKQPWAHAIVHLDKNVENRSWKPPADLIGNYIAIHAGKAFDRSAWVNVPRDEVVHGAILGVARVARVRAKMRSRWFSGPFGWILEDVRELPRPIPCVGFLNLWNVPAPVLRMIRRAFPDLEL